MWAEGKKIEEIEEEKEKKDKKINKQNYFPPHIFNLIKFKFNLIFFFFYSSFKK
jgi:hypothetical protein